MPEPVLAIEGLCYRYPGADRDSLDRIGLEVGGGELVVLAGRSGSGKTTLLRAACGLVPHFHGGECAGRLVAGGLDLRDHGPAELARVAGLVAQDPETQVVSTTVATEIELGLELRGAPAAERSRTVAALSRTLGIDSLLGRTTDSLSGGERQRVALAAALAPGPRLLLLDEPTSQLDPSAAAELIALLVRLARQRGTAIVIAEHRLERLLGVADRVAALSGGALAFDGSPAGFAAWAGRDAPGLLEARTPAPRPRHDSAAGTPALAARRLCVALGDVGGQREALRGIDLTVRPGERVALLGANGAGKSTLLRACAGLLPPSSGAVEVPRGCALLTQHPGDYLVRERVADELPDEAGERALAGVGLGWAAEADPRDLSGGERQRLALAIAMAGRGPGEDPPGLVCLDEPTRGMDGYRLAELAELLERLARGGAAVLVATHDAALARRFADRVVRLEAGRIAADGPADRAIGDPGGLATPSPDTAEAVG